MVKRRRISVADKKDQKKPDEGANVGSHGVKDAISASCPGAEPGAQPADPQGSKDSEAKDGVADVGKPPPVAPTRTSARLIKRPRRDITPPAPSPPKKPVCKPAPVTENKRIWETEDKDVFFEALCENGKDFDAIQSHIATKSRRRLNSGSTAKTKDQIRHFYYNTWHKISKYIEGVEEVKNKQAMELYALINYGELRRKIGGKLDEKRGLKLNELVHKGATIVKIRGKTHRLKTPLCRALKKLNNVEENKEDEVARVPKKIVVELRPRTNASWVYVQSMAQNPRLRLTMPPGKRIASVIEFLEKKWKPSRVRLKEKLNATEEPEQVLCLSPLAGVKFRSFDLQPIPPQPTITLALESYMEHIRSLTEGIASPPCKKVCRRPTPEGEGSANGVVPSEDKTCAVKSSTDDVGVNGTGMEPVQADIKQENNSVDHSKSANVRSAGSDLVTDSEGKSSSMNTREIVESLCMADVLPNFGKDEPQPSTEPPAAPEKDSNPTEDPELEKYRSGWRTSSDDGMTLAQIYLLLGCPETMSLEYEWEPRNREQVAPAIPTFNEHLNNMLRRLIHVASTQFKDLGRQKQAASSSQQQPSSSQCCTCGGTVNGTPPSRPSKGRNASPAGSGPGTPRGPGRPSKTSKTAAEPTIKQPDQPSTSQPPDSGVFRVPHAVPLRQNLSKVSPSSLADQNLLQQIDSLNKRPDIFMPRRRKINRNVRRSLVVQRMLLPKTQVPSRQIMTLALNRNGSFLPLTANDLLSGKAPVGPDMSGAGLAAGGPQPLNNHTHHMAASQQHVQHTLVPLTTPQTNTVVNANIVDKNGLVKTCGPPQPITVQTVTGQTVTLQPVKNPVPVTSQLDMPMTLELGSPQPPHRVGSPEHPTIPLVSTSTPTPEVVPPGRDLLQSAEPVGDLSLSDTATNMSSLTALLDYSLPAPDVSVGASDKLIDFALDNSNASFSSAFLENFKDDTNMSLTTKDDHLGSDMRSSSPLKGFTLSKDWTQTEELSLSAFLTDTPVKKPPGPQLLYESSRDSLGRGLDVDTALQTMMYENSMDYVSKFADLAAQMTNAGVERHKDDEVPSP